MLNSDKRFLSGPGEKGEMLTERHWDCSMHLPAPPTIEKMWNIGGVSCFLGTELSRQQDKIFLKKRLSSPNRIASRKKRKEKFSYINSSKKKKKRERGRFKTWSLFTIKKPAWPGLYHLLLILSKLCLFFYVSSGERGSQKPHPYNIGMGQTSLADSHSSL